jgi:Poly(ADP-ribose) polymerase and DNA-Ligase Zn-finger region
MSHVLEPAATGRSKCRACGGAIGKGELRFGERLRNPFADSEMTWWFHPACAAYRRPQSFLDAADATARLPDIDRLRNEAQRGLELHRLPRINGVERAKSARAHCRACRAPIARDAWRIPLVTFDDGMFNPAGNVHVACAQRYFGTRAILPRLVPYTADLTPPEIADLQAVLAAAT